MPIVRFSIAAFVKLSLISFLIPPVLGSGLGRYRPTWLVLLFEVGTWPHHDGFRRMGRFNLSSALANDSWQGLRTLRTHPSRKESLYST